PICRHDLYTFTALFKIMKNKEVTKTWLAGQNSCTMVIPKDFAKLYGLDQPSYVVIEGRSDGILIKRLELNSGDDDSDRNET
ncbi:MAG: AbrB/MazE/SpoVT family DNA-binding domain-containing protein, partial [Nitrososphaeraceae archaeon]